MGTMPGAPSFCQQGLRAVSPVIPHTKLFVFHATRGGCAGQSGECCRSDHMKMPRPFVCAIKLVQIRLLSDTGKKPVKTKFVRTVGINFETGIRRMTPSELVRYCTGVAEV